MTPSMNTASSVQRGLDGGRPVARAGFGLSGRHHLGDHRSWRPSPARPIRTVVPDCDGLPRDRSRRRTDPGCRPVGATSSSAYCRSRRLAAGGGGWRSHRCLPVPVLRGGRLHGCERHYRGESGSAPVLLLVLGSIHRRRLPSGSRAFTVVMAVLGLLLVSFAGGVNHPATHPVWGVLAALASGAAYALAAETASPLSQRLDTLTITASTIGVSALVLVPTGLAITGLRGDAFMTVRRHLVDRDRLPGCLHAGDRLRPPVHRSAEHAEQCRGDSHTARTRHRRADRRHAAR